VESLIVGSGDIQDEVACLITSMKPSGAHRLGDVHLGHYFASLLIATGLDVKVVPARLRHASAKTTLDTYGHLWPDRDDSSRAAVAAGNRRCQQCVALG
jgi:hypothetical protein